MVGDHLIAQFRYLYKLPVVKRNLQTLATGIKGSKGTIDNTCKADLNWGGYEETRMFNVAHLSGGNMILEKPMLQDM